MHLIIFERYGMAPDDINSDGINNPEQDDNYNSYGVNIPKEADERAKNIFKKICDQVPALPFT